jgi:predicted DNA-binding WGR domain protein
MTQKNCKHIHKYFHFKQQHQIMDEKQQQKEEEETLSSTTIEVAKSNRSTCAECKIKINKDELRIGKLISSTTYDGRMMIWHHVDCYLNKGVLTDLHELNHVTELRPNDYQLIKRKFESLKSSSLSYEENKNTLEAEKEDDDDENKGEKTSNKRIKLDYEEQLSQENALKWTIKDQLLKIKPSLIKQILEYFEYSCTNNNMDLMDQLIELKLYGILPACPECKHHTLYYKDAKYKCAGHVDEWSKCSFEESWDTPKIVRRPLMSFQNTPFAKIEPFSHWKYEDDKQHQKPFKAHEWKAENQLQVLKAGSEHRELKIKEIIKKSVFKDLPFIVDDKMENKDSLINRLQEYGAKMASLSPPLVAPTTQDVNHPQSIVFITSSYHPNIINNNNTISSSFVFVKPNFIDAAIESDKLLSNVSTTLWNANQEKEWSEIVEQVKMARDAVSMIWSNDYTTTKLRFREEEKQQQLIIKGRAAVDPKSGLCKTTHVLEEGDRIWSVTLTSSDVATGHNSFYMLQLLENDSSTMNNRFHLYRGWGRIGSKVGGQTISSDLTQEHAKKEFSKLFHEKSGNDWSTYPSSFAKQAGKMIVVDVDYSSSSSSSSNKEQNSSSGGSCTWKVNAASKLQPEVQQLVISLFDMKQMKAALAEMSINTEQMPVGKLSVKHLQKGFDVLSSIEKVLLKTYIDDKQKNKDLLPLCNAFYSIIPRVFHGKPPLINTLEMLQEQIKMVESLIEMADSIALLSHDGDENDGSGGGSMDQIQQHYNKLNCKIHALDNLSETYKMLENYVLNTHTETYQFKWVVEQIYELERDGEQERFKPFSQDNRRMLLLHGSGKMNFSSILASGLKIAPPHVPAAGYLYGKAIYNATSSSKSAQYMRCSRDNPVGFMLMNEVFIGNTYQVNRPTYMDQPPAGYNSTWAFGNASYSAHEVVRLPDGCQVPCGKLTNSGRNGIVSYDEFMVYSTDQVRLRFLLQLRMQFT